jgi:basic membrane protein A
VSLVALSFSACSPEPAKTDVFRVGVAYSTAGKRDASYGEATALGVLRAQNELKVEVREVEPAQLADFESALVSLSRGGTKLVIAVGFFYVDVLRRVAPRYKDVKYVLIDGEIENMDNVRSVMFREEQGSFLVGAIAGQTTHSKKVGVVVAMNIPILNKFVAGYRCGVRTVAPGATMLPPEYIGTGPDSFNEPLKAAEHTRSLLAQGVDVVYHVSGGSGVGVIRAAHDARIKAIGVDSDQTAVAPGSVLTSMLKRVDRVVFRTIQDSLQQKFVPGLVRWGIEATAKPGGAEDFVDYALNAQNGDLLTTPIRDKVNGLREEVRSGRLVVPDSLDKPCPAEIAAP